jgi:hypothetical protein
MEFHVFTLSIIKRQIEPSICVSHEGFDLNIDSFMFFTFIMTLVFSQIRFLIKQLCRSTRYEHKSML